MGDSFIVRLAVELGFTALKLEFPPLAGFISAFQPILGFFARKYLGFLTDKGITLIDLTEDSIEIGRQKSEYKDAIEKAYANAAAKKYTEEEKNAIRQQYLDAIRKFVRVGNGLRQ